MASHRLTAHSVVFLGHLHDVVRARIGRSKGSRESVKPAWRCSRDVISEEGDRLISKMAHDQPGRDEQRKWIRRPDTSGLQSLFPTVRVQYAAVSEANGPVLCRDD